MLLYLLVLPAFAYWTATLRFGTWGALGVAAAVFVAQIVLLYMWGGQRQKSVATRAATATATEAETETEIATPARRYKDDAPRDFPPQVIDAARIAREEAKIASMRAWRASDRLLPTDELPYPIGMMPPREGQEAERTLPDYIGESVCYKRMYFSLGKSERLEEDVFFREMYEGLERAFAAHADTGVDLDETTAPTITLEEMRPHFEFQNIEDPVRENLFVMFRSRDAEWGGFRLGNTSFCFRLARLAGFLLDVVVPAKGGGGYTVEVVFHAGSETTGNGEASRKHSSFDLKLPFSDLRSFSLLRALSGAALFFGVPVRCDTMMDV